MEGDFGGVLSHAVHDNIEARLLVLVFVVVLLPTLIQLLLKCPLRLRKTQFVQVPDVRHALQVLEQTPQLVYQTTVVLFQNFLRPTNQDIQSEEMQFLGEHFGRISVHLTSIFSRSFSKRDCR